MTLRRPSTRSENSASDHRFSPPPDTPAGKRSRTERLPRRAPLPEGRTRTAHPASTTETAEIEDAFDWRAISGPWPRHTGPDTAAGDNGIERSDRSILSHDAVAVARELEELIVRADWNTMRSRIVERESRDERKRAELRRSGDLPELSGLGRIASLDRFASDIHELRKEWSALTPEQRLEAAASAAGRELAAVDVPPFLSWDFNPRPSRASFFFPQWKLWISRALLEAPSLAADDAADLCGTVAHEARHAEQHFLAARTLAARGLDARQIVQKMRLPEPIAERAASLKLTGVAGEDLSFAHRMHDSLVVDRKVHDGILDDSGFRELAQSRASGQSALVALRREISQETIGEASNAAAWIREEIEATEARYLFYRDLATEHDAHEVGEDAALAFRAAT